MTVLKLDEGELSLFYFDQVISAIGRNLLYARVDLVRHEDRWLLMEPSLERHGQRIARDDCPGAHNFE